MMIHGEDLLTVVKNQVDNKRKKNWKRGRLRQRREDLIDFVREIQNFLDPSSVFEYS
jgi:hypothetical protein